MRRAPFRRRGILAAMLAVALTGCTGGVVDDGSADQGTVADSPGVSGAATPDASQTPAPTAPEDIKPMEVGDCLNKVGLDELGLPIPEYIDCDEPHMFEVTAIYQDAFAPGTWDFEALKDARRDECERHYTAYTGLATGKGSGNTDSAWAFDEPSQAAYDAGVYTVVCYASWPWFELREGSQRAGAVAVP